MSAGKEKNLVFGGNIRPALSDLAYLTYRLMCTLFTNVSHECSVLFKLVYIRGLLWLKTLKVLTNSVGFLLHDIDRS